MVENDPILVPLFPINNYPQFSLSPFLGIAVPDKMWFFCIVKVTVRKRMLQLVGF